ncbi:retrovirus-related pol polyprotein from transposon TNT 1-94 [Tanacetum coccineum]
MNTKAFQEVHNENEEDEDVESDDDLDDTQEGIQVDNFEMEELQNTQPSFFQNFIDEVNLADTTTPSNQNGIPKKVQKPTKSNTKPKTINMKRTGRQSGGSTLLKEHITQSKATQQRVIQYLESEMSNSNQSNKFSIEAVVSVINHLIEADLIVKGSTLWLFAMDLFEDPVKREMFMSMPDDESRMAWITMDIEKRKKIKKLHFIDILLDMVNDTDIVVEYYFKHMYKEPCMTSQKKGEDWMKDVLNGNSIRCVNALRMHPHIFKKLCRELQANYGFKSSDKMSALEKLGIFVYTLAFGVSNRDVGERFQRSGETVSRAFHDVLDAITIKGNAKFFENGEVGGSVENQVVYIHEIRDDDPLPMNVHKYTTTPDVVPVFQNQEQHLNNEQTPHEEINLPTQTSEPVGITLNKPARVRKSAIPSDYIVYLHETDFDIGIDNDPVSFSQAIKGDKSEMWIDAMKEELKSMAQNKVSDLVNFPAGTKRVGFKWVFKTKRNSKGNVERYKSRLVAKGYTQKNGVDYNETFSSVSKKDSLRIILALVAHFDLELHQMDVKTVFLNGNLEEEVYMEQPEGFSIDGKEKMVCKLKKLIYGLKQASRQWYIKFNDTITSFGFEEIIVDRCIYRKISGSKFIFLVLYVDDILLATNDIGLLHKTKEYLSKNFEMKDVGEASYVIRISISRDRSQHLLGLSQKAYIDKILERFNISKCSDVVGSLMYLQTCTRPDISFAIGMLNRYQSYPGIHHWKAAKKVLRYLQGTKDYMLTYKGSNHLEVVGYADFDYVGAKPSIIAASTMEAEFVACYEATIHPLWLRNFISGLGVVDTISKPLKMYCDNTTAIFFSKNDKCSKGLLVLCCKPMRLSSGHPFVAVTVSKLSHAHVVFIESYLDGFIDPEGWVSWPNKGGLDTVYYRECGNSGPGSGLNGRVNWPNHHVMDSNEASTFKVSNFILSQHWLVAASVPFDDN